MSETYQCDYCTRIFCDMVGIEEHIREHLAVYPETGRPKITHNKCSQHQKSHKQVKSSQYKTGTTQSNTQDNKETTKHSCMFYCIICNKPFLSVVEYQRHAENERVLMEYQCSRCSLYFENNEDLDEHRQESRCVEFATWSADEESDRVKTTHQGRRVFGSIVLQDKLNSDEKCNKNQRRDGFTYQCGKCDSTFSQFTQWVDHEETHLNKYECVLCKERFSAYFNYKRHIESKHKSRDTDTRTCGELFSCTSCDMKFDTAWNLLSHFEEHIDRKPFKCFSCPWKYDKKSDLRAHKTLKHDQTPDELPKQIPRPPLKSLQEDHNGYEELTCSTCKAVFRQQSLFILHQANHFEGTCRLCCKRKRSRFRLKHHFASHIGLVQCLSCNTLFKNTNALSMHALHCISSPFSCNVCAEHFQGGEDSIVHKQKVHVKSTREGMRKKNSKGRALVCDTCGKVLLGNERFNRHLKTHAKKPSEFLCQTCNSKHNSYHSMMKHRHIYHDEPKPYKCEICQKGFSTMDGLKCHIKRHNTPKEAKYGCDKCDKKFVSKTLLRRHSNLHMYHRKPYKCDQCEVAFAQKCNLTKHKVIHTGETPYKCKECSAAFNHRSSLIKHKYIHTGDFPHKCDVCLFGFTSLRELRLHKKAKHSGLSLYTKMSSPRT